MFLAYKLKYRNFNSTFCMYAYYFLLHTFAGVQRFARLQILIICYILCMPFYEYSNTFNSTFFSISMYSYYIYAYSTLHACSITYLFTIFFYVFSISTVILILLFLIYVFLYIYMYWALHTLYYLLICYVPLSCFL